VAGYLASAEIARGRSASGCLAQARKGAGQGAGTEKLLAATRPRHNVLAEFAGLIG